MMERLQKVLAKAGIASRRKAEELIIEGKVTVNGQVVSALGTKVDVSKDKIRVEGRPVRQAEERVYLLLNKPAGYVSTLNDPQGRPKVTDLLKGVGQRVFPVGRLDYATEGLLLLSNDGDFAYRLTHPKHGVEKVYLALVSGIPDKNKIQALRRGVQLEDGVTAPAGVRVLARMEGEALLEIRLHEGRNRQVRRMCESIGHPVLKLQRTALGRLTLRGVPLGSYRPLTGQEVRELLEKSRVNSQERKKRG